MPELYIVKTYRTIGTRDFTSIQLQQDGENRVAVSGIKGHPATETYKEAITLLARNQMYLLEASACERLAECLQHTEDDNPGCH